MYLRSDEGDYRVAGSHQLAGVLNRKLGIFTEQSPMPQFSADDLRPDLFEKARNLMKRRNRNHPWLDLDMDALLRTAGLYVAAEPPSRTLNLAAILLFGTDVAIRQAVPAYTIHKYWPLYTSGAEPHFRETRHGFELTLPFLAVEKSSSAGDTRRALVEAPGEAPDEALVESARSISRRLVATEKIILLALRDAVMGRKELLLHLGYNQPTGSYKRAMAKLLAAGLIEQTVPTTPTSKRQQYRLTKKGKTVASVIE